jgi:tetratricopeptide (TPR) repeat protein
MGQLYFLQGDLTQARHLWEQSLKAFWALHNELGVSLLVHFLTTLEGLQGNYALAEKLAEEMISLGQREGNERTQSNGLARLGMLALAQDQVQKAAACFSRILALGHTHLLDIIPAPLWWLGIIAWEKGEFSQAAEKFYELLELSRVANHPMHMAFTRWGLGRVYFAQGNLVQARAHIFQALETYKNLINESWDMIYVLEELAYTDFTLGQAERAARLLGVTEAYHQRYKNLRTSKERTLRSQAIEALRRVLDEATFNAAWEAGAAMSAGEAVEYALERCRTM